MVPNERLLLEFNQNRTKKCAFLTFRMGINIADLKKIFFIYFVFERVIFDGNI